jgi:hypothetical protein
MSRSGVFRVSLSQRERVKGEGECAALLDVWVDQPFSLSRWEREQAPAPPHFGFRQRHNLAENRVFNSVLLVGSR